MGRERASAAIVHSIIHLGRALGIGVIAEGVETEAQVQALRVAGCNQMQGYHFARPLVIEEARDLAAERFLADEPATTDATVEVADGTDG